MRHIQILGLGVGGTLIAIMLTSFFFPRTWQVEESIRIDADVHVVYALVANAQEHLNWNPTYAETSDPIADANHFVFSTGDRVDGFELTIDRRENPTSVEASTSKAGQASVAHHWDLVADGAGTHVVWIARSSKRRRFVGRFANVPIKAWVSADIEHALEALKRESERRQIGSDRSSD